MHLGGVEGWVIWGFPTDPEGSRFFPQHFEAAPQAFGGQRLVIKEKTRSKELGRTRFTYSLPRHERKHFFTVSDRITEVISLIFNRRERFCRFEADGY